MGGLQGWHLVILFLIAVVVVVIVVVVKAVTKPKQHFEVGPDGRPVRQGPPAPAGQQQVQGIQPPFQGAYPQPVQVGYGMDGRPLYQQPGTNIFAILALVLGLFTGILGIVFGHIARGQIRRTGESGDGLALAGLVVGYLWLAFWVLLIVGSVFSRI